MRILAAAYLLCRWLSPLDFGFWWLDLTAAITVFSGVYSLKI